VICETLIECLGLSVFINETEQTFNKTSLSSSKIYWCL